MLTSNDFSFLIVTQGNDLDRLSGVYQSIRSLYPNNEVVIVYENKNDIRLNPNDTNLTEVYTEKRVYVSVGYNLARQHSTKKCFVFIHDDTFLAANFLENIIPHITETQFCNFTTVEPPIYNDPDSVQKPIKDFGRDIKTFDLVKFRSFCEQHVKNISEPVVDSPFGGFFMAGFNSSMDAVGGFDEYFQPYFYEDADLMIRMHQHGFKFVQVLNSLVYHMGSLTSRGTQESINSSRITAELFLKKWKTPWEFMRTYTLANQIPYQRIPVEIIVTNGNEQLNAFLSLISESGSDMQVFVDGSKLNQQDLEFLQTLPYILQSVEDDGQYELGNLVVNYKQGRTNV